MDTNQKKRVEELMGRMAADDEAAVVPFVAEFGPVLRAVMRSHLGAMGVERVNAAELDGLAMDAAFAICDKAAGWRPDGGALPWNWADRALRDVAARSVGIHADELTDERTMTMEAPTPRSEVEHDPIETLGLLAGSDNRVALLQEALAETATPRNAAILLEVKLQDSLGDPSPANTVGAHYGMRPDAVRQVVKRTLDRLRRLICAEPRFAPLADLPLFS